MIEEEEVCIGGGKLECIAAYPYSAGTVKVMDGDMIIGCINQIKRERRIFSSIGRVIMPRYTYV